MPATDALQPLLSAAAKAVVRSYGGWTNFMHAYGLKPWDQDDAEEGRRIAETMVDHDGQR